MSRNCPGFRTLKTIGSLVDICHLANRKLLRVTLGTIDPVYSCQKEILPGVSNDENDRHSGKICHLANQIFEIYNEAFSGPTRSRADCTEKDCIAGLSKLQ